MEMVAKVQCKQNAENLMLEDSKDGARWKPRSGKDCTALDTQPLASIRCEFYKLVTAGIAETPVG